jgi:hypothetical protein
MCSIPLLVQRIAAQLPTFECCNSGTSRRSMEHERSNVCANINHKRASSSSSIHLLASTLLLLLLLPLAAAAAVGCTAVVPTAPD